MSVDQILAGQGPVVALLIAALVAGSRRIWVWGREVAVAERATALAEAGRIEMKDERDEWKTLTLSLLQLTNRSIGTAERSVTPQ